MLDIILEHLPRLKINFKRVVHFPGNGKDFLISKMSYSYHLDDMADFGDEDEEMEVTELDAQTQARLDNVVDKLLKGYDWTLAPLANK